MSLRAPDTVDPVLVQDNEENDREQWKQCLADGAEQKPPLCDPQPETKEDMAGAAENNYR